MKDRQVHGKRNLVQVSVQGGFENLTPLGVDSRNQPLKTHFFQNP